MNVCDCMNSECKILQHCKRGLGLFQGEPIDFKYICNMECKFPWISLIEENNIVESEDKQQ